MGESRFSQPRRQLRWKLTFSYTVVTVAVLITLVAAAGILTIVTSPASEWLARFQAETIACASEPRPFLGATPPDSTLLEAWLRAVVTKDEWGVVIDPSAAFVAANRREDDFELLPGQAFVDGRAPEDSQHLVDQALEGRPEVLRLDGGTALAVAPILSEEDESSVPCLVGLTPAVQIATRATGTLTDGMIDVLTPETETQIERFPAAGQ